MIEALILVGSYLLGSVSTGYLVAKYWKGIDIRKHGSGNIGATNVFRVVGPIPGLIAFLGDFLKGYLAAKIAMLYGDNSLVVLAGIAAILGHSYPLYLGFKGGKIIATGVGVIFAMNYLVAIIAVAFFIVILFIGKFVSLASILAALTVPIFLLVFNEPLPFILFAIIGVVFAVFKHMSNIKRLLQGTEPKIGNKNK